ncbi:MAG: hypothetical protein JWP01_2249 [Myxococcales bacterium]|nr:hypothetical protein [Myxococcales bacterium]
MAPSPSVLHHTFVIERRYAQPPARVFAAFADPARKRRWMGGESERHHATRDSHGETFVIDSHTLEFRVEGAERWRFRANGALMTNDTFYLDIVPDRRIVFAYTMASGDARFSSSHTTIELVPDGAGTTLIFTEQGAYFDNKAESAAAREHGTRALLDALATEVERPGNPG